MKPTKPITRREIYLDVITGGDATLPTPLTREETYLAKIAGENIEIPSPVTRYEQYLAAISGEAITVPEPLTRLEKLLYKATGEDIEVDSPVTREESYWYDYEGGETEKEYTGAVPTTITANGEPLLAWTISGNMQQTGTPTPENPIEPSECGEKTGNLFDKDNATDNYYINASNGELVYGTASCSSDYILIEQGKQYYWNDSATRTNAGAFYDSNKNYVSGWSTNVSGETYFTTPTNAMYVRLTGRKAEKDVLQLNEGSTALPYEPYGFKIPISSGGVTTPVYLSEPIRKIGEYADSVQVDGTMTRNIKKLVLDGTESWSRVALSDGSAYYTEVAIPAISAQSIDIYCTHYRASTSSENYCIRIPNSANRILIIHKEIANTTDFKAYLAQQYAAGTPVTIWYVLATPTTETISAPTIPTTAGEQTFDVDTSLKPSEVYIKYKGK